MGGGWKLVVDDVKGQEYWERRSGTVVAKVVLEVVNGSSVWGYQVSCANHMTLGYKETKRDAKKEATKLLKWYALREHDLKRTSTNLRAWWLSKGIEEVEPVRGGYWEQNAHCAVVYGVKWEYDYESRKWKSGAWELWCEPVGRWVLRHPDGYVQFLHISGGHNAMLEAYFWMARCLA